MRRVAAIAVAASLCLAGAAAADDHAVLAPIKTFLRAANTGNRALLISAFTPDSAIVDEFAPFRFRSPGAAARWYDGFGADQQANGVTDAVITALPPKFVTVSGSHAYVVLPTAYTYRIHGKPAKETGSLAFALVKPGSRWEIGTMAWAKLTDTSIP